MSKSKTKPDISYENGRWSIGNFSTSAPNKLINHLRKRYQMEMSLEDVKALAVGESPAETAAPPAPPEDSADENKES